MKLLLATTAAFALSAPALAQMNHGSMPGMRMPPKPTSKPEVSAKPKPTTETMPGMDAAPPKQAEPASTRQPAPMDHDMSTMPEAGAGVADAPVSADPHAGHDMSTAADVGAAEPAGSAPAPAPPGDHAADAIFGADAMARARKVLAYEVGGMGYSLVVFDLLEVSMRKGRESYRFEGEGFAGGNINRFGLKVEGEGGFGGRFDDLEVQALYSRAIAPYFNLQLGVRHDFKPDPSRTYLVGGLEGFAPYWFKINAAGFVSTKGEVRARLEAYYDQRITQALILQPRIEANASFQDIRELGVGSGLTDFEAGLRLRYEVIQEVAPYIGVEWRTKAGATARFARLAGDDPTTTSLVAGIRIWF